MEAARAAIANHTARQGHFTNVEESVRPAITWETVKPHRHEEMTEAVDREVHQHHYHTTVQPVSHTETLPTKHTHNLIPVRRVTIQHDDEAATQRRVADLASKFRHSSVTSPVTHSRASLPQVIGERHHHHVHETVQPVIYKETVQREHVHTTVPIHEVHHAKAEHHSMSALPIKKLEEFLQFQVGRKTDEIRHSQHEGAPRAYDSKLSTDFEKLEAMFRPHSGAHSGVSGPLNNNTMNRNSVGTANGLNNNTNLMNRNMPGTANGLNNTTTPMGNGIATPNNRATPNMTDVSTTTSTRSAPGMNNGVTTTNFSSTPNADITTTTNTTSGFGTPTRTTPGVGNVMTDRNTPPHHFNNNTTDSNSRLLQRKPTPPKLHQLNNPTTPVRSSGGMMTSPGNEGLMSSRSSSSVSSSPPSTPNSPTYRDAMGNRTSAMNPSGFGNENRTSGLTGNPTTQPTKSVQIAQPVSIINDGETSPRVSDDNPHRRRSFMDRITGRGGRVNRAY